MATAISWEPMYRLYPDSSGTLYFYVDLDHYRLSRIERLREGRDLLISMTLCFAIVSAGDPSSRQWVTGVTIPGKVHKSDWVEGILPKLGFKEEALIEVPKIEEPELSGVVNVINDAWKYYSMGEYKEVLKKCREAMEGLAKIVRDRGFSKESTNEKGEKETIPDWGKVLGDEDMGEIIGAIIKKHYGFLAPAAHYGKVMDRADAELAIMLTHGLVNFISKKLRA